MIWAAFFHYVLKYNWRTIQIQMNYYVLDNLSSLSADSSLSFADSKDED